ncbi:hypothetical protein [Xenorhabdus bovienii]|uniref:hypothetical protein n=1 Tax=Xenorhabdus bovienii TaxID=40576 RepID=UPI003DA2BB1E
MDMVTEFIPITAFVAIILFFVKESVEVFKKRTAKKREIDAFKYLCAKNCMFNKRRIMEMLLIAVFIKSLEEDKYIKIEHYRGDDFILIGSGSLMFDTKRFFLPKMHDSFFHDNMLNIAKLDGEFLCHIEDAYESIFNTQSLVNKIIHYVDVDDKKIVTDELKFLAKKLYKSLLNTDKKLGILYHYCTGMDMKNGEY